MLPLPLPSADLPPARTTGQAPKGPRPLKPALPREDIAVPDPDAGARVCLHTGHPTRAWHVARTVVLLSHAA